MQGQHNTKADPHEKKGEKEKSRELQITDHPDRLRREIERYKRLYEHELCLLDAFRLRLAQHHSCKQSTDAAASQAEESPHHDQQLSEPADARMPTKMLKPTMKADMMRKRSMQDSGPVIGATRQRAASHDISATASATSSDYNAILVAPVIMAESCSSVILTKRQMKEREKREKQDKKEKLKKQKQARKEQNQKKEKIEKEKKQPKEEDKKKKQKKAS